MSAVTMLKVGAGVAGGALALGAAAGAIGGFSQKSERFLDAPTTQQSRDSIRNSLVGLVGGVVAGALYAGVSKQVVFLPKLTVANAAVLGALTGAMALGAGTMAFNVTH